MLDSAFYFPQYYTAINNVVTSNLGSNDVFHNGGATQQIQQLWSARATDWGNAPAKGGIGVPPADIPVNFLDNHDVGRFLFYQNFGIDLADLGAGILTQAQFDAVRAAKLKNAYVFMFTEQGVPCVYYGDEQGFQGGNDPTNREDLLALQLRHDRDHRPDHRRRLRQLRRVDPEAHRPAQEVPRPHPRRPERGVVHHRHRLRGGRGHLRLRALRRRRGQRVRAGRAQHQPRSRELAPPASGNTMKVTAVPGTMLVDVLADEPVTYSVAADGTLAIEVQPLAAAVLVPAEPGRRQLTRP